MSDQKLDALKKANKTRTARAKVRRDLYVLSHQQGKLRAAELICESPPEIEGMTVVALLQSIRGVGQSYVRTCLRKLALTDLKLVGTLTERQRREMAELLVDGVPEGVKVAPQNGRVRTRTQETVAAKVDTEVGAAIRKRADAHGVSISKEVAGLLRKALAEELAA